MFLGGKKNKIAFTGCHGYCDFNAFLRRENSKIFINVTGKAKWYVVGPLICWGKRASSGFCGSINYRILFYAVCCVFYVPKYNLICWLDLIYQYAQDRFFRITSTESIQLWLCFEREIFSYFTSFFPFNSRFLQEHSTERHKTYELLETSRNCWRRWCVDGKK